jgi:hypothetical protein
MAAPFMAHPFLDARRRATGLVFGELGVGEHCLHLHQVVAHGGARRLAPWVRGPRKSRDVSVAVSGPFGKLRAGSSLRSG